MCEGEIKTKRGTLNFQAFLSSPQLTHCCFLGPYLIAVVFLTFDLKKRLVRTKKCDVTVLSVRRNKKSQLKTSLFFLLRLITDLRNLTKQI